MPRWLLLLLCLSGPAAADEVVLVSGATLTGVVVAEDEREVSIRTELGLIRVPRDRVAEVRRDGSAAAPPAPVAASMERVFSLEGIDPAVAPASAGAFVAVALAGGRVVAVDPRAGGTVWSSAPVPEAIAGLAADPSGVYVSTGTGGVARLDPRDGRRLWAVAAATRIHGPPLVTRRGVFVFAPGEGLVGLDPATGNRRGALLLPEFVPDTPLAATEDSILVGEAGGAAVAFSADGTAPRGYHETGVRWNGAPLAISGRRLVVAAEGGLVLLDEAATAGRTLALPGLIAHPLGADPVRAFVSLGRGPAAVDLRTGRVLWRSEAAGRVTHLAGEGARLLAATDEERVVALSPSDGRVLFTADLGSPAASAPVAFGDGFVVVTADGRCLGFGPAATPPPPPPDTGGAATFRSADGYRFELPAGWTVYEPSIRGEVSVALRPDSAAGATPAFRGLDAAGRSLLATRSEIAIRVLPAQASPAQEFREVPADRATPGRVHREFVRQMDGRRLLTLSFACPETLRAAAEPGLLDILHGLAPDDAGPVAEEVAAAEAVLDALNRGDLEPVLPLLGTALWKSGDAGKPAMDGVTCRLLTRSSREAGRFRRVRVRIDDAGATRFTDLLLGSEGGRMVVTDWSGLR
jgi:outer membrane protein assembly factor BamB